MAPEWVDGYLEAWNSHDGTRVAGFMREDVTYEDLAQRAVYHGRTAVEGYVRGAHEWSADYRFLVVTAQSTGARYAIEWEMHGTSTGEAGGVPATGKPYRIRGVSVGQVDDTGLITLNRDYWNYADYLAQQGLFTPPGQ